MPRPECTGFIDTHADLGPISVRVPVWQQLSLWGGMGSGAHGCSELAQPEPSAAQTWREGRCPSYPPGDQSLWLRSGTPEQGLGDRELSGWGRGEESARALRLGGRGLGNSRSCIRVSARGARVCGGWGTWDLGGLHSVMPCCHSYRPSLAPAHPQLLLQNYLLLGSDLRFSTRPLFSPPLPAPLHLSRLGFLHHSPFLFFHRHPVSPFPISRLPPGSPPTSFLPFHSSSSVSPPSCSVSHSSPSLPPLPPSASGRGGKNPRGWGWRWR